MKPNSDIVNGRRSRRESGVEKFRAPLLTPLRGTPAVHEQLAGKANRNCLERPTCLGCKNRFK